MNIDESQLEKFLLDSSLVSNKELNEVKSALGEDVSGLGTALVSRGILTTDDLRRAEAYILGLPFVDLKNQKIDLATLSLVPEPIARKHHVIAFKKSDDALEAAMLDMKELSTLDFLKSKSKLKINPHLTSEESLKIALLSYQKGLKAEYGDLIQKEAASIKEGVPVKEETVLRILSTLWKHAQFQNAFEIHFEPQASSLLIRYRIGGSLYEAMVLPQRLSSPIVDGIKTLSHLSLEEKRLPQEGRFRLVGDGEQMSFRVSTIPVSNGEKVMVRILNGRDSGFTLESLGANDAQVEQIHQVLKSGSGLIVVSGEPKSGKTTTLYTLLDILNRPELNLSTVEDPVAFPMPFVNQVQVRREIGLTFPQALRAVLKQSPNVLMVGEVKDREALTIALNAAQSAIVLTSLEAKSAEGAEKLLKAMKVDQTLLTKALKMVIQLGSKDARGVKEVVLL